jgi:hypothetical protein
MIVKYHSNQNKTDPYIAENASKNTNQSHEKVADLVEDQVEMIEVLDLVIEMTDHEKCLTQNAEIVEMIVKYHLDQRKIDLYIAENASKNTDNINKFFEKNTQNFVTFIRINNYKLTQSLMIK